MDFQIDHWITQLKGKLKDTFAERMVFLGLQGSYRRSEATQNSDIDIVLILNRLSIQDLQRYQDILAGMPYADKACGFVCGSNELKGWPRADAFQLYFDTKPIYGSLDPLILPIGKEDAREGMRMNASVLYHTLCHGFLFESAHLDILKNAYKTAFFILQAKLYVETGIFNTTKAELESTLSGIDKKILEVGRNWDIQKKDVADNITLHYERLLSWCSTLLEQ